MTHEISLSVTFNIEGLNLHAPIYRLFKNAGPNGLSFMGNLFGKGNIDG
jgi:hypothetical protein